MQRHFVRTAIALLLASGLSSMAATVPAGTQLAAKQELTRNKAPSPIPWTRRWRRVRRPTTYCAICLRA